jgi:hypothetical protein
MDGEATRMRAAITALPFEHPKLAVIANVNSFAARMEEIGRRAGRSNVIDARPATELDQGIDLQTPQAG